MDHLVDRTRIRKLFAIDGNDSSSENEDEHMYF